MSAPIDASTSAPDPRPPVGQGRTADGADSSPAILSLRDVHKRFTGTHALKGVSLDFRPGEIHAIVGENGAGKSTLIKIMTGAYQATSGEMFWDGAPIALDTPLTALKLGLNAVHQEVVLCRHLTVAANMALGAEATRFGFLQHGAMVKRAQQTLDDIGFKLPATALLGSLTIGQQQLVATARAAARGCKLLILDEPTGYLTRAETDQLFALIRRLHAEGVTIVYISHRMEEIFELADRVSVLRDGNLIATREVAATTPEELIRDMVARSIDEVHYKEEIPKGEMLLEVERLSGPGFSDVSLTLRRGEIVGLYGLIGAGRSEFAQVLFGRNGKTGGTVKLKGRPLELRNVREAIDAGIVLLPESRRDQGLCLNLDVRFNLSLPSLKRMNVGGFVRAGSERQVAGKQIGDLRIATSGDDALALTLSGGNQQKIVIGKWLEHGSDVFIFDEPTVGVDVGTKVQIYQLVAELLKQGAGVIIISSYLPEVYDLADTLHVFRAGRVAASYGAREVDHETILGKALGN